MDVPTLMHNLKEEVSCAVCMQVYTDPKQLPCLHIFCLHCLNNVARTSTRNGRIRCPLCQADVVVPECGTMESLPDCFYLKNLLDILAIKKCNTAKVTCGNCEKKSDEMSYCFHCGEFWCKVCLSGHNIIRANKEHRVLALKDFKDKDFEDVLKRPAFCPKELHDKEVLKFFCKVCNVPVCQTCVIVDHVGHIVEHLEVTARAVKDNIMVELEFAKKAAQSYASAVQDLEEKLNSIENSTQATTEKIRLTTQAIILKLQGFEEKLTAQVEGQGKEAQERLTESKVKVQAQLTRYKETISQVEHLIGRSTAAELVRAQTHLNELFHEQKDELGQQSRGENINFDFVPNQSFLQSIDSLDTETLGSLLLDPTTAHTCKCTVMGIQNAMVGKEVQLELITRNSSGEQCYCPFDHISAQSFDAEICDIPTELPINIQDYKNGRYIVSFIPKVSGKMKAQVTVNGKHIMLPLLVQIKERSYQSGGAIYSDPNFYNPWGVAVNASSEIFVTDMNNNQVKVFDKNGEFVRSFGKSLLSAPNGICIDDAGRIYVVDRRNNRILLFNSVGKFLREVVEENMSGCHLNEPRGISLDPQGNIVVCNSGNRSVQLFSLEGELLLTFYGCANGLEFPFDCLYHDGKIYISDFTSHSIKVFSKNGNFLFEFGRQGSGDGEFQKPTGLAKDKARNLLICDEFNHRVQVFTGDGTFITKFGSYGRGLGQMDRPIGVAVLNNGCIVVAEFQSNRLQFFN